MARRNLFNDWQPSFGTVNAASGRSRRLALSAARAGQVARDLVDHQIEMMQRHRACSNGWIEMTLVSAQVISGFCRSVFSTLPQLNRREVGIVGGLRL
jgi:hypothetical protein